MKIVCDGHEYNVVKADTEDGQVNLVNNYGSIVAIARPAFGMLKLFDTKDGKEFKTYSLADDNLPPLEDMPALFVQEYILHNPQHNQ